MKIVAIKDVSAGNDSVGGMRKEIKIFDSTDKLSAIMSWVEPKKNVVLLKLVEKTHVT